MPLVFRCRLKSGSSTLNQSSSHFRLHTGPVWIWMQWALPTNTMIGNPLSAAASKSFGRSPLSRRSAHSPPARRSAWVRCAPCFFSRAWKWWVSFNAAQPSRKAAASICASATAVAGALGSRSASTASCPAARRRSTSGSQARTALASVRNTLCTATPCWSNTWMLRWIPRGVSSVMAKAAFQPPGTGAGRCPGKPPGPFGRWPIPSPRDTAPCAHGRNVRCG